MFSLFTTSLSCYLPVLGLVGVGKTGTTMLARLRDAGMDLLEAGGL
jgi:hypothetical protein